MRTKISNYWPLVAVAALVVLAGLRAYEQCEPHEPLAAEQVSAELARTVSYGLVGDGAAHASPVAGEGVSASVPQAS
ncbi:MAG TPA: hypothetical protein VGZ01_08935 [Trinickia sp.]|nr:hypothetical protein [Trinickia sp.]